MITTRVGTFAEEYPDATPSMRRAIGEHEEAHVVNRDHEQLGPRACVTIA